MDETEQIVSQFDILELHELLDCMLVKANRYKLIDDTSVTPESEKEILKKIAEKLGEEA